MEKIWKWNKEKIGVMGHRGCCGYMPENTLISFREAFRLGVDVLEFDVHSTRDGELVVIHDGMVDRTTNGTGAINFMTLDEVKSLDAGVKYGYPNQTIPTLRETLECIVKESPKGMLIDLEIKDQRPYVVDKTIEMLKEYNLLDKTVFDSFDGQTLLYIKKEYPNVRYHLQPPCRMERFDERLFEGASALAIPVRFTDEEIKDLIDLANNYNLEVWAYITDTTEQIERALKFGFTNLTANDPRTLIKYLDERNIRCEK